MTATVLRTGTSKRTSRQIEEDLRRLGADLGYIGGAGYQRHLFCWPQRICRAAVATGFRIIAGSHFSRGGIRAGTAAKVGGSEARTHVAWIPGGRALAQGSVRVASVRARFAE